MTTIPAPTPPPKPALTEADFRAAAERLTRAAGAPVSVAAVKAVAEVESPKGGFVSHAGALVPTILFEPHIFHARSGRHPVSRDFPCLSAPYPESRQRYNHVCGRAVPPGYDRQHVKLTLAAGLDAHYGTGTDELRVAALESASYGRFQVMGFNWRVCDYDSLQAFINDQWSGEPGQLRAFVGFIEGRRLADELARHDWVALALGYNGSDALRWGYHTKMAAAYRKHAA